MRRTLRRILKQASVRVFLSSDQLGFHLLPKHYYTPVPDIGMLRKHRDMWVEPVDLDHLAWDLDAQVRWLRKMCDPYYPEVEALEVYAAAQVAATGPGYGPIESQVLHCFVRTIRPRRIVEVGSGMSTYCLLNAASLNSHEDRPMPLITCIEPFPRPALEEERRVTLLAEPAQTVDKAVFSQLEAGDLLFIDSSHVVKTGADLHRIYLNVLPNLVPGVFVHIHDIYLPYLYSRDVLNSYCDWQETSLLLALLTDNTRFEVLSCLSALHYDRTDELRAILKDYRPMPNDYGLAPRGAPGHFPSSIFLRTSSADRYGNVGPV